MIFGQLIKFDMNIFLEKSYTKYGGKASPDPFIKNKIEPISGATV